MLKIYGPRNGIHALGGGIGQGLAMGIGAAIRSEGRKTVVLCGDGGLMLNLGELATSVQEGSDLTLLLMNDKGYGVIRNIQDAYYEGRRFFSDLNPPNFGLDCQSLGLPHWKFSSLSDFDSIFRESIEY